MGGILAMSWLDIDAYARIAGLERWEALTVRRMSQAYVEGYLQAENQFAMSPLDQHEAD